jgi:hypothetical protein
MMLVFRHRFTIVSIFIQYFFRCHLFHYICIAFPGRCFRYSRLKISAIKNEFSSDCVFPCTVPSASVTLLSLGESSETAR